ncbi:uncharacterized protein F5147DRAFT_659424 [Suillus discolor]|uniref:Uncharacterized protein n=1 Tax=Suillus discolor TaxID=1912936 RepID=A0A9P7JLG9_9AGAM|nr:uncharacterized protein F5147DRAFT_659424 [Suillus discolor]KAG2085638.1 hypothetical protein F5147DRAFT_659424 [Suillus discolor]
MNRTSCYRDDSLMLRQMLSKSKSIRVRNGSGRPNQNWTVWEELELRTVFRSSSSWRKNHGPNRGEPDQKSGSNHGSGPDCGSTIYEITRDDSEEDFEDLESGINKGAQLSARSASTTAQNQATGDEDKDDIESEMDEYGYGGLDEEEEATDEEDEEQGDGLEEANDEVGLEDGEDDAMDEYEGLGLAAVMNVTISLLPAMQVTTSLPTSMQVSITLA